jgi:4'-phosphopantetheinyl transferase EntD
VRGDFEALAGRLAALGVCIAARRIAPGDEAAFPEPGESLLRRRASGAARLAARACLAALGGPADAPLPRGAGRFPLWPQGFVGSLAHDAETAVAVAARAENFAGLGVDVEPAEPLPPDVAEIALLASERPALARDPARGRAIFAAKEAVYKALNPLDGSAPEYEDIEIDLDAGRARLSDGRALRLEAARGAHWIVVALSGPPVAPS